MSFGVVAPQHRESIGGAFVLASQIGGVLVMQTVAWHRFADAMFGLWPA